MTIRLPSDYMSAFVNVARLICGGDAPTWLAEQLWCWNGRLHQDRHVEEFRPTRAEMRSILQDIEDHLFSVTEAVESPWVREFLDASPDGPIAEQRIRELEDLFYRISQMRTCSALATKSGATKPGPGKARPEAISPRTLCAIMVWDASKHVHGEEPSPKNRRLAEAAEAYWRIAGGKAQNYEAQNYGEQPLALWRHHFKKAASSMARNFRAEWRRHLVESERDWKRRNSAHAEP